jgi:hypothetical protein
MSLSQGTKVVFDRFYIPSIIFNHTNLYFERRGSQTIADYFKQRGRVALIIRCVAEPEDTTNTTVAVPLHGFYSQESNHRIFQLAGFVTNKESLQPPELIPFREKIQFMFQTGHKYSHDVLIIEGFGSAPQIAQLFQQEILKSHGLFHSIVFTSAEYVDVYANIFNKN